MKTPYCTINSLIWITGLLLFLILSFKNPAMCQERFNYNESDSVNSPQEKGEAAKLKTFKIKFKPVLELGYGRVFKYYHIEPNPNYGVTIAEELNKGNEISIGFSGELIYLSTLSVIPGFQYSYQFYQWNSYYPNSKYSSRILEEYAYVNLPLKLSVNFHVKKILISPVIGWSTDLFLNSLMSETYTDSLNKSFKVIADRNFFSKNYSSGFLGVRLGKSDTKVTLEIKYFFGFTKIKINDNPVNAHIYPETNAYFIKNKIFFSLNFLII